MFHFTQQERTVLFILTLIIFVGSSFHYALKKYPPLNDIVHFMEGERLYRKVNLNTATVEELVAVPYIGPYTAKNILDYRQQHGPFTSMTQIKNVKGIKKSNYEKFYKYLKISR